jgi:hypothetical protein
MKSIISKKIAWLAKTHRLLLDTHMRCRKSKSIETTLEMLIEQIHIVWDKNTNRIVTLLSLNVADAFDTISHDRLIHDLRKQKISMWITDWVNNFFQDRKTILTMNRRTIELFSMQTKISQSSSLFLILYLFYNADLLKMCDRLEINTRSLKYVDDVNILVYEKSTNENCRNLERVHKLCERWATRHEFDVTITIRIESDIIQSKTNIRILSVQIDTRLKWDSHVRKVQEKIMKQLMTLIKLSTFIWDIIFRKIRILYIFVVRSILIYETTVWHVFKKKKTRTISKLAIIQNRCLRSIFETFRVILIAVLKTETHVALIDIHLNRLQTHARYRMRVEDMSTMIRKTCDRITNKLSDDSERSRLHRLISSELKRA